jgi:hypothetical protein
MIGKFQKERIQMTMYIVPIFQKYKITKNL